ncbi:ISAs1 family transposase [Streptomyces sp. NPDC090493]|uniref:ISAs1 family transposase n=1 Tax=Streptomyces sp. NPDC090493 TaxID=3365964 RepID=UPI00381C0CDC
MPDPRGLRGRRYLLSALVAAAAASVLAGARSLSAITEWIADAPAWACLALGFPVDPLTGAVSVPHPHTLRRLLVQLDGDALDQVIGAFLTARAAPAPAGLRAVAVDGKVLRGSRTATTPAVTLLAAMDHTGTVLAQRQVAGKSNEIPAFAPLLDTIDLTSTVITADALHTQHAHGTYLQACGAHYIAVVKANHPGVFDRVRHLPWQDIGLDHYERTRAHHRQEIRRLKTAAFAHIDYPDAQQALQVVRWRRDFSTGKLTIERVYLITSLPPGAA